MLIKEFLPAIESAQGYLEDITDFFNGSQMVSMLSQNTQNKKETVPAVGDDRIREHGVSCNPFAVCTDQSADTEADLDRAAIDELDQGTVIVTMDLKIAPVFTIRTGFLSWDEVLHTVTVNVLSGTFF